MHAWARTWGRIERWVCNLSLRGRSLGLFLCLPSALRLPPSALRRTPFAFDVLICGGLILVTLAAFWRVGGANSSITTTGCTCSRTPRCVPA